MLSAGKEVSEGKRIAYSTSFESPDSRKLRETVMQRQRQRRYLLLLRQRRGWVGKKVIDRKRTEESRKLVIQHESVPGPCDCVEQTRTSRSTCMVGSCAEYNIWGTSVPLYQHRLRHNTHLGLRTAVKNGLGAGFRVEDSP